MTELVDRLIRRTKEGSMHPSIETTLREIGSEYKRGFVDWIKKQPVEWARLLSLEGEINKATLSGDEVGLTQALTAYRAFLSKQKAK